MLIKVSESIDAFTHAAGIAPASLSLSIRTILLIFFFLWGAWCLLELLRYYKSHPNSSMGDLFKDYTKVFFLVSVVIALVFI